MALVCPNVYNNTDPLQKQQKQHGCLPCFLFFPLMRRPKHCGHGSSLFHLHPASADHDDDPLHDSCQTPPPLRHQHPIISSAPPHHFTSIVWRDGLLQSLGRLHSTGNCKLSLGELLDLDDNSCLDHHLSLPPASVLSSGDSKMSFSSRSSSSLAQILTVSKDGEQECVVAHSNCLYETNSRKQCEITE